jgi:hypothetical protein
METLSIDDIYQLNHGIAQIYTLKDLDTFGVAALKIVDRLVPGEFPMFHVTHCRSAKIEYTFYLFAAKSRSSERMFAITNAAIW